jgi:hypothetical protein
VEGPGCAIDGGLECLDTWWSCPVDTWNCDSKSLFSSSSFFFEGAYCVVQADFKLSIWGYKLSIMCLPWCPDSNDFWLFSLAHHPSPAKFYDLFNGCAVSNLELPILFMLLIALLAGWTVCLCVRWSTLALLPALPGWFFCKIIMLKKSALLKITNGSSLSADILTLLSQLFLHSPQPNGATDVCYSNTSYIVETLCLCACWCFQPDWPLSLLSLLLPCYHRKA